MTAMALAALALVGIADGWATDNGAELIFGFLCLLLAFSCLMARDWKRNHHVLFDREEM